MPLQYSESYVTLSGAKGILGAYLDWAINPQMRLTDLPRY